MFRHMPVLLALALAVLPSPAPAAAEAIFRGRIHAVLPRPPGRPRDVRQQLSTVQSYSRERQGRERRSGRLLRRHQGHDLVARQLCRQGARARTPSAPTMSPARRPRWSTSASQGDRVTHTEVVPPPKKRGKDWVPLGAGDLSAVADPIAATIIRAPSLDEVCGRTIKMYRRRTARRPEADPGRRPARCRSRASRADTVTCRMGFEPVSGYRKGKQALELPEGPQPNHGDVCADRRNRSICADLRHRRHGDRHRSPSRRGGSKQPIEARSAPPGRDTWGARH